MEAINSNNKLIRKIILSMFGGSLAAMITTAIALMADTILAGVFFDKLAIAAVAVGTPIINIFQALTQSIINGASIKMNISAGKGEPQEVQDSFSVAVFFTVIIGLIFAALGFTLADKLVDVFGGSPEIAGRAVWYLRGATGCIIFGNINLFMYKTLALFGEQKAILRSSLLAVVFNIVFSFIFVKIFPANMAIAGLGMGTWFGGIVSIVSSCLTLKKYGISFKINLGSVKFAKVAHFVSHGIASSGNALADGVVSGVVNNVIVSGFNASGVLALSVFTAVKSVATFATAIIQAVNLSVAPLFGIMYGSRDRNGILRSYRESVRLAIIALGICAVVIMACSPILAKVYDMTGMADFYIGMAICMVFYLPLTALLRITTQFFESIEKVGIGFLYSAIPDSLIFPILLAILVPLLKYNGIWIAYSFNAIPFIIVLYILRSLKNRKISLSYDRIFCLDGDIRDNVPKIDISIKSDNRDVSFISEQVYTFLENEGVDKKTAHTTALCLEELSADFVEHTVGEDTQKGENIIMDIKLFSDSDQLRTIIRNEAPMYNPLDFESDSDKLAKMGVKLAQKLAHSINYSYVYKMNIITIVIDKNKE